MDSGIDFTYPEIDFQMRLDVAGGKEGEYASLQESACGSAPKKLLRRMIPRSDGGKKIWFHAVITLFEANPTLIKQPKYTCTNVVRSRSIMRHEDGRMKLKMPSLCLTPAWASMKGVIRSMRVFEGLRRSLTPSSMTFRSSC